MSLMISKNVIGIYARGGLFAGDGGLFVGGPFAAGLIAGGLFASGLNAATHSHGGLHPALRWRRGALALGQTRGK